MLMRSQCSDLGVVTEHCQSDSEDADVGTRQREYGKFRRSCYVATQAVFSQTSIKTKDMQWVFVASEMLLPFIVGKCVGFMCRTVPLLEFLFELNLKPATYEAFV